VARSRTRSADTGANGFSIVEVLLAGATFSLIITALVGGLVYGREASALGGARGRAALLAEEGLEAVRNIADEDIANLVDGTYGLAQSGGVWTFLGVSDVTDQFTRVIGISTVDAEHKEVTSTVTWQQNPSRTGQVQLTTRFSTWTETTLPRGGLLAYSDTSGADDVVRYRTLSAAGTWSAELTVPDFGVPLDRDTVRIELYSSPTRNEKVLVTKHSQAGAGDDQYLYAQVWDGTTWGDVTALASWTGTTRPDVRDFDGAYLDSGDFLLVYEDETPGGGFNDVQSVSWDGASWSAATNLPSIPAGATADWIVVRNRPGTDEAMMAVLSSEDDTRSVYYSGGAWGGAYTSHGTGHPGPQFEGVAFEWAPLDAATPPTYGALVYNEASDNFPNVQLYDATLSTWGSSVENLDVGGEARTFQLTTNSVAAEWLLCVKDDSAPRRDINCIQTGTTPLWTATTNGEIATDSATGSQRSMTVGYERLSGDPAAAVYSQGVNAAARATPKWRSFTASTDTWSAEASLTALGGAAAELVTTESVPDPYGNDILFMMAGANATLSTIVWDGSSDAFYAAGGRAQTAQASSGTGNDDTYWFDFAWDLTN